MLHTVLRLIANVFVGDACCFERQANELSASWNARPVQQFVRRLGACFLVRRHGGGGGGGVISNRN